ncbi:hypothetical protein CRE_21798 [Caenorhabditis remanei]|uniref:Uncharacterized protein n=1 Tax=Caenorhabditis remanei TaxID=31234 RepID=E3MEJ2_CAERE|nr:hypothetical protein CRE_21798 [Caenorhabditis remanei]
MKVLLGIGLLLSFNDVLAVANWKKRATISEVMSFMESLNAFRRQIAQSYNVGNMNELRYDIDIEAEIEQTIKTCNDVGKVTKYVPYLPPDEGTWNIVKKWNIDDKSKLIEEGNQEALQKFGFMMLLVKNLLHPRQVKIGCFELEEPCSVDLEDGSTFKFGVSTIKYEVVCLIGSSLSDSPTDVVKGEPGSKCDSGQQQDGLCKVIGDGINWNEEFGHGGAAGQAAALSSKENVSCLFAFAFILTVFVWL